MKLNLAVDCGGTKVAAIAFDNDWRPAFSLLTGSVRGNSTPKPIADGNMKALVDGLEAHGVDSIGVLCGAVQSDLAGYIRSRIPVGTERHLSELEIGLAAAFVHPDDDGVLVLSGTGSGIYSRIGGKFAYTGGYGSAVADEGSGYDIGRQAFRAAVADFEGYGEHTMITDMICRKYGCDNLRDAIFGGIYGSETVSPTSSVAAGAKLAASAAEQGDAVAIGILRSAGEILGRQAAAHFTREGIRGDVRTVTSGGVWKLSQIFAETVGAELRRHIPGAEIISPSLEPVGGAVAFLCMENSPRGYAEELFGKPEFEAYKIRKPNPIIYK